MDLYNILEIEPSANENEIKKAYLRLVKIYHPDKNNSPDANEKFQKIQSAYEILSNHSSRIEYQKLNQKDKSIFVEILEKIIGEEISLSEFNKYGIKLSKSDLEYLQKNFINFFKSINVGELLKFFKKGEVPRKEINMLAGSESEDYSEYDCEYFKTLPISFQKINKLDIRLDLNVKLGDVINNNKRKIKIKRNINNKTINCSFLFNLSNPYVVFVGAGDVESIETGNLIIKLNLPNNLYWNDDLIIIEQSMTLYEMIYGLDISLDIGEGEKYVIEKWVSSRDGLLIDINKYKLAIKLYLNYENTEEKELILKQYFS